MGQVFFTGHGVDLTGSCFNIGSCVTVFHMSAGHVLDVDCYETVAMPVHPLTWNEASCMLCISIVVNITDAAMSNLFNFSLSDSAPPAAGADLE